MIFNTQEEFLKEFPITDGIINCRNQSFELKFDLSVKANICNALNIKAWNIDAWNIKAWDIKAWNIKAWNINAGNIDAMDISFHAVCFAHNDILCRSIKSKRQNSKYFSLDGKITIDGVIQELKEI